MPLVPEVAGFVLVGGQSSRMGRDKALLTNAHGSLAERVANVVGQACDFNALLGDPARYAHLNLPVVADIIPGQGPMSGLHAALKSTKAEWILIVACDLPNIDAELLKHLIASTGPGIRCVAADAGQGRSLEPLCAVYHRSTLKEVETALQARSLRMRDLTAQLGAIGIKADERLIRNINTAEDWQLHLLQNESQTSQ